MEVELMKSFRIPARRPLPSFPTDFFLFRCFVLFIFLSAVAVVGPPAKGETDEDHVLFWCKYDGSIEQSHHHQEDRNHDIK